MVTQPLDTDGKTASENSCAESMLPVARAPTRDSCKVCQGPDAGVLQPPAQVCVGGGGRWSWQAPHMPTQCLGGAPPGKQHHAISWNVVRQGQQGGGTNGLTVREAERPSHYTSSVGK